MANLVDTLGSWSSARAQRRRVASDLAGRAVRAAEREAAAKERIAAALEQANSMTQVQA
ncbi:hypothetical protein J4G43_027690 [Bradyrhizobium barranii subsp. barranii]|uniref:Uncharacterized protein n=1 Tax=Bradyrhizobium barranii subsp. barranii TaxID=2823807 RepID=A0A939S5Z3_9BRAD|nr:hypothetical protein [Bradyrhizobium barranii]UEM08562.1 hypothetical protein J4G43_027690 [Bradyrhizobium barranii subsp. barranii]